MPEGFMPNKRMKGRQGKRGGTDWLLRIEASILSVVLLTHPARLLWFLVATSW